MQHQKYIYPLAVALITMLIAGLLIATAEPVAGNNEARSALTVSAIKVNATTIQFEVRSQGSIEPRVQSQLIPEVSGIVAWVSPTMVAGGNMRAGEALLRIEQADYQSQLSSAKAALTRTRSQQQRSNKEYQRIIQLHKKKLASQTLLESSKSDFQVAEANFAEAKALLAKAERELKRTTITAPYDGLVREESVDVGQFIARGQSIATVYATDNVEVRLPIADSQLAFLDLQGISNGNVKPRATLRGTFAGQQQNWEASIDRMEAQIDHKSRMLNAVAKLQVTEEQPAPIGLFIKARIKGISRDGLFVVPRSALRGERHVLLIRDGRLQRQAVNVVRLENQRAIIDAGLSNGDIVCTSRNQALAQGTEVRADIQP